jgi:hypothetical protein
VLPTRRISRSAPDADKRRHTLETMKARHINRAFLSIRQPSSSVAAVCGVIRGSLPDRASMGEQRWPSSSLM